MDYFIIGRWFGPAALGFYTLAYQLAVVPGQRVMMITHRVIFPSLSTIQDDPSRMRRGLITSTRSLFVLLVPMTIGIFFFGPWLIEWLYGDEWLAAIPPIRILAISGLFYGLDIVQSYYLAIGQPKIRLWISSLRLGLFVVLLLIIGEGLGIVGVAIAVTISVALSSLFGFGLASRLANVSVKDWLIAFWPTMLAGGLTTAALAIYASAFGGVEPFLSIVIGSLIFTGIYVPLIYREYGPLIRRQWETVKSLAVSRGVKQA